MVRLGRVDFTGAFQHGWAVGLNGCAIYMDDQDRLTYLEMMERVLVRTATRCLSWALMTNHNHWGLESGPAGISNVFHCAHTRYAQYFNARHGRVGPLFDGRFNSEPRDQHSSLESLISYVHLNPVRSPLVSSLDALANYPWSGHRELLGLVPPRLVDVDFVLSLFGSERDPARAAMLEYLRQDLLRTDYERKAGPAGGSPPPVRLSRRDQGDLTAFGVTDLALGTETLEWLRQGSDSKRMRRAVWAREGGSFDRLLADVCRVAHASPWSLRSGRRRASEAVARAILAHVACDLLGFSGAEVARQVGVSEQAIAQARVRGRELVVARNLDCESLLGLLPPA